MMEQAGRKLHLKGHLAGLNPAGLSYGPGDLVQKIIKLDFLQSQEGHLGTDGNFYVLDFGRVFPPEAP